MVEVHPASEEAEYDSEVRFHCTTEAQDQYGVEWLFYEDGSDDSITICVGDSVYAEVRHKYDCQNEAKGHTLIIKQVRNIDSGTYTCIEDGGRGPGSNSSRLTVLRE